MTEKKPYQPKSLFERIFDEHTNWLFQQGYHERTLGSRDRPGRLFSDLRETFEKAILQTLWKYRMEEFQIGTRGVFGPKKDPVDFAFHYRYDPHRLRLDLTQLSARLYEETIQYPIANNTRRQLPPADLVHAQLSAVISAQVLERIKEQKHSSGQKQRPR